MNWKKKFECLPTIKGVELKRNGYYVFEDGDSCIKDIELDTEYGETIFVFKLLDIIDEEVTFLGSIDTLYWEDYENWFVCEATEEQIARFKRKNEN